MYKNFFGLNRNPFELSPDPSFICPSEKNNEALSLISYAISLRKGFVVLTGEVGTGKTLMLRCLFESWRRQGIAFANIFAPRLSVIDFLTYVASDLGIGTTEPTKGNLLRAFYAFLSAQSAKGLTTVLVIDEAHQAPAHVLEEIRMLTNVETDREKLVQVVLVGQPELDEKLDSFELRQLKQRIAVRCHLEPLREEETRRYIEQRLVVAGADLSSRRIFPPETIRCIHQYSRGIPRIVNSLCDQALVAACTQHIRVVPVEIVEQVASRFRLTPAGAPKDLASPGVMPMPSAAYSNRASIRVQESQEPRRRRPAVAAVWQASRWPAFPKRRILLSAAALAVAVVLSVGGIVTLFHRGPDTLAYSVPKRPEALVPESPSKLASDSGEVTPHRVPATESDAASVPKIVQPESQTSKPANDPLEVASRRTISPGKLSKPIAKSGRVSISNASAPILDAQESLLPSIDIHSLDSILSNPPTPTGGQMIEARLISSTPPVYPRWAFSEGVHGMVVIDALVDRTGKLKDMKAISGPPPLIHAAMDALRSWKYEPARLNDQPVEVHTTVQINFSLP